MSRTSLMKMKLGSNSLALKGIMYKDVTEILTEGREVALHEDHRGNINAGQGKTKFLGLKGTLKKKGSIKKKSLTFKRKTTKGKIREFWKGRKIGEMPAIAEARPSTSHDSAQCLDEANALQTKESSNDTIILQTQRILVLRNRELIHPAPRVLVLRNRKVNIRTVLRRKKAVKQKIKKILAKNDAFFEEILKSMIYSQKDKEKGMSSEQINKMKEQLCLGGSMSQWVVRVQPLMEEEKLPELTPHMLNFVEREYDNIKNSAEKNFGSCKISAADLRTLFPYTWLNDEVVNTYMEMVAERAQGDDYPSVHIFNTFFYARLVTSGYRSVKRWTKKVDIFSKDLLIIPLHLVVHWALAVVDFRQETITFYDSMLKSCGAVLENIKKYLVYERMDKKKENFDTSSWELKVTEEIPGQGNTFDCGVFMCAYAEHLTRGIVNGSKKSAKCKWSYPPFPFSQDNMLYFRTRVLYEILTGELLG